MGVGGFAGAEDGDKENLTGLPKNTWARGQGAAGLSCVVANQRVEPIWPTGAQNRCVELLWGDGVAR